MKLLGQIHASYKDDKGKTVPYTCEVKEGDDLIVRFRADADIDADGANGQGSITLAAYMRYDKGIEALANGGMKMVAGQVMPAASWWKDIVITTPDGSKPQLFPNGLIASKTAYRYPRADVRDPFAYVDSAVVPYVCVPPMVIAKTKGAVLGCMCRVTNFMTKQSAWGVAADVGPRTKIGEISVAMAQKVGVPSSPRRGGTSRPIIDYEVMPGVPAEFDGLKFQLLTSRGTFLP